MATVMAARLVVLETSGRVGQVALAEGDQLRGVQRLDETRRHARDLAPAVLELLQAQGWLASSITDVVVSRGPGSYTGLRVGIMSAKTLAYATGCRLIAVDTFAAIAEGVQMGTEVLEVIADAQQEKVYRQCFGRAGADGGWQAVDPLGIVTLESWLGQRDNGVPVTGPGLHAYGARLPICVQQLSADRWDPTVEAVLRLGLIRRRQGLIENPWMLEPLYLRPSAAEEKRLARIAGAQ
jgi:tRNA threonylcarbamoyladenosine biosynthesis protein TsaB